MRPVPAETRQTDQLIGSTGVFMLILAAAVPAIFIWIPDPFISLVLIGVLALAGMSASWELLIALMLGAAFFVGPVKIYYGGWVPYAIAEIVPVMILLRWLLAEMQTGGSYLKGTPLSTPFLWLASYLVIEFANPASTILRSLFGFRSWLIHTMMFFVGYSVYRGADQVERLFRVLALIGVATAIYGIYQWQQGPAALEALGGGYVRYAQESGYLFWNGRGVGPTFRAPGAYTSSNAFGMNMAFLIVAALGPLLSKALPFRTRMLYAVSILVMGIAIPCSGSRAPAAYLGGSLIIIAILMRQNKAAIAVLPLAYLAVTLGNSVTSGRFINRYATLSDPNTYLWKWLVPLLGSVTSMNDAFGKGLGYAVGAPALLGTGRWTEFERNTIDSGYGAVAQELGPPGLLIFICFAVAVGIAAVKAWRALPPGPTRDAFLGPAVWGIAYPIWTFLATPHASLPATLYLWLFLGMLMRAGTISRGAPRDGAPILRVRSAPMTSRASRWRTR